MAAKIAPSEMNDAWRVIAIPGAPSRFLLFMRLLALAPIDLDFTVVMRPGYAPSGGRSPAPVLDFEDQVAAIAPLLERDDQRPTILLGVSYGGALALKCALDHPDRIAGVITSGMLVREPHKHVRLAARAGGAPWLRELLPAHTDTARRELAARRRQFEALAERLPSTRQPVTIVHGNRDWVVPCASAAELRGLFAPNADIVLKHIEGGTHYLECERPRLILSEIDALKARVQSKTPAPV